VSGIDYANLPIYRGALADAVGFSPDDLAANRAGRLSTAQRASLLRDDRIRVGFVGLCGVAATASFVMAVTFGLSELRALKFWVFAAFFAIAAGIGVKSAEQLWRDVRTGVVSGVEGFVSSTLDQSGSAQEYYWVVQGRRFSVTGDMYTVLEAGRYWLYFLPRTRRVMSVEPLEGETAGS
jgi:hypothetical protein